MRTTLIRSSSNTSSEHRLLHVSVLQERDAMIAEFDGRRARTAMENRAEGKDTLLGSAKLDRDIAQLQYMNSSRVRGLLAVRAATKEQPQETGNFLSRMGQGLRAWWKGKEWVEAEKRKAEEKVRNASKEKIRAQLRHNSKEDLRDNMNAMLSSRHYAMKQIAQRSNETGMELELLRADMGHAKTMLSALQAEKAKFEQKREMYQIVQNFINSTEQVTVPGLKETETTINMLEEVVRDLEAAEAAEQAKYGQDAEAVAQLDERHKTLLTTLESYLVDRPGELIYLEKALYENAAGHGSSLQNIIYRLFQENKLDKDHAWRLQQIAAQIGDAKNANVAGLLYGQMLRKKTEAGQKANQSGNLLQTMQSLKTIGRYQQFDIQMEDSDFRQQWTVTQTNGNYVHLAGAGRRALINTEALGNVYQMLTEDGGQKKFYTLGKPAMKDANGKLQRDFTDQTVIYLDAKSEQPAQRKTFDTAPVVDEQPLGKKTSLPVIRSANNNDDSGNGKPVRADEATPAPLQFEI